MSIVDFDTGIVDNFFLHNKAQSENPPAIGEVLKQRPVRRSRTSTNSQNPIIKTETKVGSQPSSQVSSPTNDSSNVDLIQGGNVLDSGISQEPQIPQLQRKPPIQPSQLNIDNKIDSSSQANAKEVILELKRLFLASND